MKLTEKAAYLKGLADGMGLASDTNEQKLLHSIIDLLAELADKTEDLDDEMDAVCDELDEVEADLYGLDDADDEDADDDAESGVEYELTCPKCGATTVVDEDTLMSQEIVCSKCGAPFDIEFDGEEEDETPAGE